MKHRRVAATITPRRADAANAAAGMVGRQATLNRTAGQTARKNSRNGMRIERARENVFTVTATSQELSVLVAAARMALEAMRSAPEPPPAAALDTLERVLSGFDQARERLGEERQGDG